MRLIVILAVMSSMIVPALAARDPHPPANPWTCHCDSDGNPHVHKGKSGHSH